MNWLSVNKINQHEKVKMKKIIMMVCGLICYSNVFASQSPITCPATLTCNYAAGTCDLPPGKWALDGNVAQQPFTTVNLSSIIGATLYLSPTISQQPELICEYDYQGSDGKPYHMTIIAAVKKFVGPNWLFSGFGNNMATCQSSADPTICAAE